MSTCLTQRQIDDYAERRLEPAKLLRLNRHVSTCPECKQKVITRPSVMAAAARTMGSLGTESTPCLSFKDLAAYVDGEFSDNRRLPIARHVAGCTLCSAVVADLSELGGQPAPGRCESCGKVMRDAGKFCVWCGTSVTPSTETTARTKPCPMPKEARQSPSPRRADGEGAFGTANAMQVPAYLAQRPRGDMTIGPYEVIEELGRSGMGIVYKAVQTSLRRTVAIKLLDDACTRSPELLDRFKREAQAAASMQDPNIVTVYETRLDEPPYYYAMEFLPGGTLKERVDGKHLNPKDLLPAFQALCRGLDAIHRRGMVHRDIKPDNLMADEHGRWKITDFGIVKDTDCTVAGTSTGSQFGTIPYMSPEQIEDSSKVTQRSDVYAAAATIYHALSGRPPFEGSMLNVMHSITQGMYPPLSSVRPNLRNLDLVLAKAMASDPRQRYRTCSELFADLQNAIVLGPSDRTRQRAAVTAADARLAYEYVPRYAFRKASFAPILVAAGGALLLVASVTLLQRPGVSTTRIPSPAIKVPDRGPSPASPDEIATGPVAQNGEQSAGVAMSAPRAPEIEPEMRVAIITEDNTEQQAVEHALRRTMGDVKGSSFVGGDDLDTIKAAVPDAGNLTSPDIAKRISDTGRPADWAVVIAPDDNSEEPARRTIRVVNIRNGKTVFEQDLSSGVAESVASASSALRGALHLRPEQEPTEVIAGSPGGNQAIKAMRKRASVRTSAPPRSSTPSLPTPPR